MIEADVRARAWEARVLSAYLQSLRREIENKKLQVAGYKIACEVKAELDLVAEKLARLRESVTC